jgi:hypothetical protein
MTRTLPTMTLRTMFAGLATASLFLIGLGSPSRAEAKAEKWWNPDRGDNVRTERVERPRSFHRQWRNAGGQRVYRDVIVIRDSYRAPRYRAWRTYSQPVFIYSQRVIRVRPVRFSVAASFMIGGVHIRGTYTKHDDYEYGCNFCDARFDDYASYHAHVMGCANRPAGYRIECSDWNDNGAGSHDDDGWRDDDSYDRGYDHDYDRGDSDHGRYDDDDYDR